MIQQTESWRSILTIILTGKSLRSCLWENLRVSMSLAHAESSSRLNAIKSRSRSEADSWESMSSSTSIPRPNSRNWRGKTHSRNSQRRLCYRRQWHRSQLASNHQLSLRWDKGLQAALLSRRRRLWRKRHQWEVPLVIRSMNYPSDEWVRLNKQVKRFNEIKYVEIRKRTRRGK